MPKQTTLEWMAYLSEGSRNKPRAMRDCFTAGKAGTHALCAWRRSQVYQMIPAYIFVTFLKAFIPQIICHRFQYTSQFCAWPQSESIWRNRSLCMTIRICNNDTKVVLSLRYEWSLLVGKREGPWMFLDLQPILNAKKHKRTNAHAISPYPVILLRWKNALSLLL